MVDIDRRPVPVLEQSELESILAPVLGAEDREVGHAKAGVHLDSDVEHRLGSGAVVFDELCYVVGGSRLVPVGMLVKGIDQSSDVRGDRLAVLLGVEHLAQDLQPLVGSKRSFPLPIAEDLQV
jgi:hypothetical protein